MSKKYQQYKEMQERHIMQITKDAESWAGFLDMASRVYKYSFDEQILIHAQKPETTAAATLEQWNKAMNRYPRKGSKGIALLDKNATSKSKLKHVFDVADTDPGWRNARELKAWQLNEMNERPVMAALNGLNESKEAPQGNTTAEAILNTARGLIETWNEDYPEDNMNTEEKERHSEFITNSVAYAVMKRCGIDTYEHIDKDSLALVQNYRSIEEIGAMGAELNNITETLLRQIEQTVKQHERETIKERGQENATIRQNRADVQVGGRLPDTQHSDAGAGRTVDQIRADETGISGEPQAEEVHDISTERRNQRTLLGGTGTGRGEAGSADEKPLGEEPVTPQNKI